MLKPWVVKARRNPFLYVWALYSVILNMGLRGHVQCFRADQHSYRRMVANKEISNYYNFFLSHTLHGLPQEIYIIKNMHYQSHPIGGKTEAQKKMQYLSKQLELLRECDLKRCLLFQNPRSREGGDHHRPSHDVKELHLSEVTRATSSTKTQPLVTAFPEKYCTGGGGYSLCLRHPASQERHLND